MRMVLSSSVPRSMTLPPRELPERGRIPRTKDIPIRGPGLNCVDSSWKQ